MSEEVRNRFGELHDMFCGVLHLSPPQQLVRLSLEPCVPLKTDRVDIVHH